MSTMVINPRAFAAGRDSGKVAVRALWDALPQLEVLETLGRGNDYLRVAEWVRERKPELVIAVSGDGTLNDIVNGLMQIEAKERPALGFLPLGTANNVARSLGLESCRRGVEAVKRAIQAITAGRERRIDLGQVNGRWFIGSMAIGMDSDILRLRNRIRVRVNRAVGGYPIYLLSCAINLLRPHGSMVALEVDGRVETVRAYNLLINNTPVYAGEFRFVAGDPSRDGLLDLHVFTGPLHYLREYPAAWPRHLRARRGLCVKDSRTRRTARRISVTFAGSTVFQLDGEEAPAASRFEVVVHPGALRVRVP